VGVDIDPVRIECARRNARVEGVEGTVQFECADFLTGFRQDSVFDIAFSIGAFEHFPNPGACLHLIHDCLAPAGLLAARFGPLWCSPYGAHMSGFTPVPWVHAFFPESVVLRVRKELYRPSQDALRYEDIDGHLNRITFQRFKRLARQAGFVIRALRLNPEKDAKWGGCLRPLNSALNALVGVRELYAFSVLGVLAKT
jgi:SAM-dependent methyltransferase